MPRPLSEARIREFRDSLCRVATRRFAESGYGGVTMRALAIELGCSPMTPYRYFSGKDEIFATVRAAAFGRFADTCEAANASSDDADERLSALGDAYLRFALDEPDAYRVMFELDQPHDQFPELEKQSERARQTKLFAVAEAVRAGVLHGDPFMLAHVFWASLHGVIVLQLAGKLTQGPSVEALAAATMQAIRTGVSTHPEQESRS